MHSPLHETFEKMEEIVTNDIMIQQNLGINNVTDSDFSYPKMPKDTREFFGLNSYSSSLRTSLHYQVYF